MAGTREQRVFLQAVALLVLDPENRDGGRVGGYSDRLLKERIIACYRQLYPDEKLSVKQLQYFVEYERESPTGILVGSGWDNFVRWENVTTQMRDLRQLFVMKLARSKSTTIAQRQDDLGREQHDEVLRLFGL